MLIIMKYTSFRPYCWQIMLLIPLAILVHHYKEVFVNRNYRYSQQTNVQVVDVPEQKCKRMHYDILHLRKDIIDLYEKVVELENWKENFMQNFERQLGSKFDEFYSDQVGFLDYAAEYSGGSILSTPDTTPYPSRFGIRIFGLFNWLPNSQPKLLIEHANFPGKCFAFHGNKGRVLIKLGRPVLITHISLEHMRLKGSINSAPKDFQVLGFGDQGEENLGHFRYDLNQQIIQTFAVECKNKSFQIVELRVIDNYGNAEFTCIYRFRVHSLI